jgi:hypothetical protein
MATADCYVVPRRQHRQLADAAGPVACCAYLAGITNDSTVLGWERPRPDGSLVAPA